MTTTSGMIFFVVSEKGLPGGSDGKETAGDPSSVPRMWEDPLEKNTHSSILA